MIRTHSLYIHGITTPHSIYTVDISITHSMSKAMSPALKWMNKYFMVYCNYNAVMCLGCLPKVIIHFDQESPSIHTTSSSLLASAAASQPSSHLDACIMQMYWEEVGWWWLYSWDGNGIGMKSYCSMICHYKLSVSSKFIKSNFHDKKRPFTLVTKERNERTRWGDWMHEWMSCWLRCTVGKALFISHIS